MQLSDLNFTDIYLSEEKRYLAGLDNMPSPLVAPDSLKDELDELWEECEKRGDSAQREGFALVWKGGVMRVSVMDTLSTRTYVLRPMPKSIPALTDLGVHPKITDKLLAKEVSGLIIIAGTFGSGKTTTASALVAERLNQHGGVAITIEDPPEMPLEGEHGMGVCFQIAVNENEQDRTFYQISKRAARWSPDIMFYGEIRDGFSAYEALKSAVNGKLIICTLHGDTIPNSLERYCSIANENKDVSDVSDLLSAGLFAVIHQKLVGQKKRLEATFLFLREESAEGAANNIKNKRFKSLETSIMRQLNVLLRSGKK